MEKVAVYRFELMDRQARAWKRTEYFATVEHIDRLAGARLLGTKILVTADEVTPDGIYRPTRG